MSISHESNELVISLTPFRACTHPVKTMDSWTKWPLIIPAPVMKAIQTPAPGIPVMILKYRSQLGAINLSSNMHTWMSAFKFNDSRMTCLHWKFLPPKKRGIQFCSIFSYAVRGKPSKPNWWQNTMLGVTCMSLGGCTGFPVIPPTPACQSVVNHNHTSSPSLSADLYGTKHLNTCKSPIFDLPVSTFVLGSVCRIVLNSECVCAVIQWPTKHRWGVLPIESKWSWSQNVSINSWTIPTHTFSVPAGLIFPGDSREW